MGHLIIFLTVIRRKLFKKYTVFNSAIIKIIFLTNLYKKCITHRLQL